MAEDTKRILIRGVNWIGDAVLTIPAISAIRLAYPDAHICLLVKPWVAELFKESRDIDEIMLYNDDHNGLAGKFRLAATLRKKNFDKAILLQNAFDAALITRLAGIPERVGYKRDARGLLLTDAVPVKDKTMKQHQVFYYLDLLKAVGINKSEVHPYINLTDKERGWAKEKLSTSAIADHPSPVIGINPGAAYGSAKRWLPESFTEVARRIIDELGGRVILFGGPSEVEIVNEIVKKAQRAESETSHASRVTDYASRILNFAGKTDLRQLSALISECDAFISNDSGPMHMASALYVPTVAIFGSTDSTATGPFGEGHMIVTKGVACAPCLERVCPEGHLKCMTDITSDDVFNALSKVLPRKRAVFLDKDGTIIKDKHYLNSFDDIEILPEAGDGLKELKENGFKLIGITNQSGITRGLVDEFFTRESNAYLQNELNIDDFYYCPHHPDEKCHCRKPEPLMLFKAREKHHIALKSSYMIGDKESDVLVSKKTGVTGILISETAAEETSASYVAKTLKDAADWILERELQKDA